MPFHNYSCGKNHIQYSIIKKKIAKYVVTRHIYKGIPFFLCIFIKFSVAPKCVREQRMDR